MSHVLFRHVVKRYGAYTALDGVDLEVKEGEFLSLLGPSGCGKTTALRLVAGFVEPTSGEIVMDGRGMAGVPPQRRDVGMVFQDYALFPHLSVAENVAFGLRERGRRGRELEARVAELLELVRLPGLAGRYPAELSGGQQQRVALARALAFRPKVLLMDEPLGALDLKLREAMQAELRRLHRALAVTTIYVTHDQGEAMALSDRIAVMAAGRIVQLAPPEEIYKRPATRFVAEFVGKVNLLSARPAGATPSHLVLDYCGRRILCPRGGPGAAPGAAGGEALTVMIRPEALMLYAPGLAPEGCNAVEGTVVDRVFAGSLVHATVELDPATQFLVEARPGDPLTAPGTRVALAWKPEGSSLLVPGNGEKT